MIRRVPDQQTLISVVLPAYNEAAVLERLVGSLREALQPAAANYELIFVDDGSTDGGAQILDSLAALDHRIKVIHFSRRNFGHQAAVLAGLQHASGDAVIVMDSDMQDDPQAIALFLENWCRGYDVVYAVRVARKENVVRRFLFHAFYRVLNLAANMPLPSDAGNFGLVDGKIARQIPELGDQDRYFPGLRQWVGFRQIGVPVERKSRHDRTPRVSLLQLFQLAKTAIISFSTLPLTIFYMIAASSLFVFVALSGFALYHKLFTGQAIPGWASTMMTASFFGALNAMGIAILGEYVTRIYDQVRARPPYIVARHVNLESDGGGSVALSPASPGPHAELFDR